ncbi:MAG: LemA family protein [Gemmatimonadaceae bacterium]
MIGFLFLVVVAALVFWLISAYNGLVALRNQVTNAWKQIDVQLKRRHDLVPNLIATVRGAMQHERETLEAVMAARSQAMAVERAGASVAQTAAVEAQLTGALGRLLAVVEAYPEIRATANIAQLHEELTSTENRISFARQLYNDTATMYNTRQEQFPTNLISGIADCAPAELWEIEIAAERAVPQVSLAWRPGMAAPAKQQG